MTDGMICTENPVNPNQPSAWLLSWLLWVTALDINIITLRASCSAVYCNRSCLFVGVFVGLLPWQLEIACIDSHQTGFVGKGSDHLQLIKFWPSRAPGKRSSSGGTLEEHSRFHDASPGRRSFARRNAEWSPRLSGLRSLSIVRSQDWRGRPLERRQSTGRRSVDARSAREWSSEAAARATCPNSLRRRCCTSEETGGSAAGENFWLRLTTTSAQCLRLSERFFSFIIVVVIKIATIPSFTESRLGRHIRVMYNKLYKLWCFHCRKACPVSGA